MTTVTQTFVTLDDFAHADHSHFGTAWQFQSDQSVGGESEGGFTIHSESSPPYLELTGQVSLQNRLRAEDGGYLQVGLPLLYARLLYNASAFTGVRLTCACPQEAAIAPEHYEVRLQTRELSMPWQYYRQRFQPTAEQQHIDLPFSAFESVHTSHPLNPAYLLHLGIVAGQANFKPQLHLYKVGFYGPSH